VYLKRGFKNKNIARTKAQVLAHRKGAQLAEAC